MSVTIDLPATFSFESRGTTYTVGTDNPVDSLPADVVAQLALHGLKQKLADSLADKTKTEGKEEEIIGKVYAALVAGEWRTKADAKPALSPLDSIIWDMIEKAVRTAIMARDKVTKVKSLTEAQLKEIADKTPLAFDKPENRERFRAAAEAELAARNAAKALTIEL